MYSIKLEIKKKSSFLSSGHLSSKKNNLATIIIYLCPYEFRTYFLWYKYWELRLMKIWFQVIS